MLPGMELTFPAALFQSSGFTASFVIFLLLEILSLLVMGIVVAEFMMLRKKHTQFFRAMRGGEHADTETFPTMILWVYIFFTVFAGIVTTAIFLFQPHIF